MATEIDARFWFDQQDYAPEVSFLNMVGAISRWPKAIVEWQGLRIVDYSTDQTVLNVKDKLSTEEVEHLAIGYKGSSLKWATALVYRCWRFKGLKADEGFMRLGVEAWGNTYAERHGRQMRMEGNASMSTQTVGPYCAIIDTEKFPEAKEVNDRVGDNLEDLADVLYGVVNFVKPRYMKVFNDAGEFFPFNAHLAYYSALSQVVDDIQLIAELWEHGLPSYKITALRDIDPIKKDFYFHPWRDGETRSKLKQRFDSTISRVSRVNNETLQRVISSERFDIYNLPEGFAILEYPHFFNSFLDRFYLEILDNN